MSLINNLGRLFNCGLRLLFAGLMKGVVWACLGGNRGEQEEKMVRRLSTVVAA